MKTVCASVLFWVVAAGIGLAQTTTGAIDGTVRDTTGGVLAGVTIEVQGTTDERAVVSDAAGVYHAPGLTPGAYTLTARLSNFGTTTIRDIVVAVNRTVTVDVRMNPAGRTESVTVVAAPSLDLTTSSTSRIVSRETIDAIPLNGRNYVDLMRLLPGVTVNETAGANGVDRDTRGSVFGERAGNTAFLVDGVENSDDLHGGVLQSFTQDAVQEFEVIQAGYKAEFGRGSGGVVNVLTRMGANSWSGSGLYFLRNDALDASVIKGQNPPALDRRDWDMTLGGPLTFDRSWFFGSLERLRETRQSLFPPNIPARLSASEDFSREPLTSNFRGFGKYTRRFTANHELTATMSWTRLISDNQLSSATALPSSSANSVTNTGLGSVTLKSFFGPQAVLETTFDARGQNFDQNQQTALTRSYHLSFLDDGSSFDFGPPSGSIQTLNQRYYTGREAFSWFRGRHGVKSGVELTRTTADGVNGQALLNVIATTRANFQTYGADSFQLPQGVAFLNPGDNLTRLRNTGVSVFGQDDWSVAGPLTLNLGVRYDYDSRFGDGNNVAPRLGMVWSPDGKTAVRANWGLFYDRYRLGIAQAVPELGGFNGQTLVELDYPRLADDALVAPSGSLGRIARTLGPDFLNSAFGIPFGSLVTASTVQGLTGMTASQFTTAVNNYLAATGQRFVPVDFSPLSGYLRQNLSAGFQDAVTVARPFKTPFNSTVTVGVQRQLLPDFSAGVTYVHRNIENILGVRITNLSPVSRTVGAPVTTDGGPVQRTYGPFYDGKYDGIVFEAEKRFGKRLQMQASYVYARSTDNLLNSNLLLGVSAQGGGSVPTDNLNLEFDRGHSDLFVPHAFVMSGVVTLPADVSVSGVFRATSGMYFSAAGAPIDYDGDGISSTRPLGTARNQFRGPAMSNLDVRFEKRFKVKAFTASGLVEFFNLLNASNPLLIDNAFVNGAPVSTFGTVKVPLSGRETQIGLRLRF